MSFSPQYSLDSNINNTGNTQTSSFHSTSSSQQQQSHNSDTNTLQAVEEGQAQQTLLQQSSHPTALIFHFLFRTAAIITYLLCRFFYDNFIFNFVIIVLLLAFDFWTVKNVTGRLLVGLRWWNEVKEDGSESVWKFESRKVRIKPNPIDSRLFWISLYGFVVIWFVFGIVGFIGFKIEWLTIVIIAIVLNMANVIGYSKCDKEAKKKITNMVGSSLLTSFVANRFGI